RRIACPSYWNAHRFLWGTTGRYQNPCRSFAEVSYALLCTVVQFATDLRTRGSWVQVLPGAPIFKGLRAASEAVSRCAGPLPDLLCTPLSAAHSLPAARYRCLHVSKLSWPA